MTTKTLHKELTISNKLGLHARACAKLVGLTKQFKHDIYISKILVNYDINTIQKINAKSLMAIMMLAISYNTKVVFTVVGDDIDILNESLTQISALINNKFGEAN